MLYKLCPSKYKLPCWLRRLGHSWPTFYSLLAKFILSWFQKSTYGQWHSTQRDMYIYTVIFIYDILWALQREKRASHGKPGRGNICLIRAKKSVQRECCRAGRAGLCYRKHCCFLSLCGSEFAWTWENCTDRDTSQVKYMGANWKQLRRVGGEASTFGHGSP